MFNKVSYRRGVMEGVILLHAGPFWRFDYPRVFPRLGFCSSSFAISDFTISGCSFLGNAAYYVYEA